MTAQTVHFEPIALIVISGVKAQQLLITFAATFATLPFLPFPSFTRPFLFISAARLDCLEWKKSGRFDVGLTIGGHGRTAPFRCHAAEIFPLIKSLIITGKLATTAIRCMHLWLT